MTHALGRRGFALWALAAALAPAARAQQAPRRLLADMHSHAGMRQGTASADLRQAMEASGVTLLAWALVDDAAFTRTTPQGVQQVREPEPGALWDFFQRRVKRYDAQLRQWNLAKALTPADVDATLAGAPRIVMASESANFLEGDPRRVAEAHAMGLRHLQLVHFIASPLGDLQTAMPRHNGMPPVARQVLQECRRLGVLVDLAHCTPDFVDAALDATEAPVVWSHSWVSRRPTSWRDWPNVARGLPLAQAQRIARSGGVVGLWTVRVRSDASYAVQDAASYADEIARMVDWLGPEGVAFGTDLDGAGSTPVLASYAELAEVAEHLARRGMPDSVLQAVCIGNYARVLKRAMRG